MSSSRNESTEGEDSYERNTLDYECCIRSVRTEGKEPGGGRRRHFDAGHERASTAVDLRTIRPNGTEWTPKYDALRHSQIATPSRPPTSDRSHRSTAYLYLLVHRTGIVSSVSPKGSPSALLTGSEQHCEGLLP